MPDTNPHARLPHPHRESVRRWVLHADESTPVGEQLDRALDAIARAMDGERETERILAAALGYPRYGDCDDDPPDNPDEFVIGDHTAQSLAMEAARRLHARSPAVGTQTEPATDTLTPEGAAKRAETRAQRRESTAGIRELIERSSLGTPGAKALRKSATGQPLTEEEFAAAERELDELSAELRTLPREMGGGSEIGGNNHA